MIEFTRSRFCRGCKTKDKCCGDDFLGYYYADDTHTEIRKCNGYRNYEKVRNLEIDCAHADVTTDYTWDSYMGDKSRKNVDKLKRYSVEHERFHDKSLYIYGRNSTQKTSMVKVLGKELLKNGHSVKYVLMQDLITILCDCDDFDADKVREAEAKRNELLKVEYLIVDECFDKSKVTIFKSGYQIPYLDTFMRRRLEVNRLPIIYVSNVEPSRIEDSGYGASVQALVTRNTLGALLEFSDNYYESRNADAFDDIFA